MSTQPSASSAATPEAGPAIGMEAKESPEKQAPAPASTSEAKKEDPVAATEPTVPEEKAPTAPAVSEAKAEGPSSEAPLTEALAKTTLTDDPPNTNTTTTTGPVWPDYDPIGSFADVYNSLDKLIQEAGYDEIYGIKLSTKENPFYTKLILQKFLRANNNVIAKTRKQLLDTLKWRKRFNPLKCMEESHDQSKFAGLGYIVELENVPGSKNKKDVCTFNIYGAIKDPKMVFGDMDGFLRWRVGLMERSVHMLGLSTATEPIPNYQFGPDPYKGFQVHDYLGVSFLRMDAATKAASKKTIEIFGHYYPETLDHKFFVNVPIIMSWVFAAMKLFVASETQQKFKVLSYGNTLAKELGTSLPKSYGGTAEELDVIGVQLKLEEMKVEVKKEGAEEEVKKDEAKEEVKKDEAKEEVKKDETKV